MARTKVLVGMCSSHHQVTVEPWSPRVPTQCPNPPCSQPITWTSGREGGS